MPTIKQKKAFKAIGENGGIISKAMATAGYAPSITHATEKLVNSRGWKELTKRYLSDEILAKKHHQLLNAESETVQLGAVKLGYEVTGKVSQQQMPTQQLTITNNFFTNPELQAATKRYAEEIKKAMYEGKILNGTNETKQSLSILQDD